MNHPYQVRFDDFPRGTPEGFYPDENYYDLYVPILDNFIKNGIKTLVAVVGELVNRRDIEYLKSSKLLVGLHGFDHGLGRWKRLLSSGGEFAGYSKQFIRWKLTRCLQRFSGINIKIFVPPFNLFTQELLDVLNEYNFEYITGGPGTREYRMDQLKFGNLKLLLTLPPYYGRSNEINRLYEQKRLDLGHNSITLHLPWEVFEVPNYQQELNLLLERMKNL